MQCLAFDTSVFFMTGGGVAAWNRSTVDIAVLLYMEITSTSSNIFFLQWKRKMGEMLTAMFVQVNVHHE